MGQLALDSSRRQVDASHIGSAAEHWHVLDPYCLGSYNKSTFACKAGGD